MTQVEPSREKKSGIGALLIGLGFAALLLLGIRTIAGGDVWAHLVAGRWIAEHGLPRADVFSFALRQDAWILDTWRYDQWIFAAWSHLGPNAVILIHALVVVAAYALLLPAARAHAGPAAVATALIFCGWMTAPVFTVGPAMLALIFPAAMIFLLYRKRPLVIMWGGVLLAQWLWTGVHLSFFVGPAICVAFAYEAGRKARGAGDEDAAEAPYVSRNQLLLLAIAAFAITFLNPYGSLLHAHAFASWADPVTRMIRVWISPFSSEFGSHVARHTITAGLALGALGLLAYRKRLPGGLTVLAIIGAGLAVSRVSPPQLFALLAFPFFALSLSAGGQGILRVVEKRAPRHVGTMTGLASILAAVLGIVSLAAVGSGAYYRSTGSASAPGLGINYDLFPEDASVIIEHPDFPEEALNLVQDGAFLTWRYPDRKVFTDARALLYGVTFYKLFNEALSGNDKEWAAFVNSHQPEAFIMNCSWPGAARAIRTLVVKRNWQLAYFDGSTAVLLKKDEKHAALAGDAEIQAKGLALLEEARQTYRQHKQDASGAGAAPRLIGAAGVFFNLQRFQEAAAAYELLTEGVPNMGSAWMNLGAALLETGDAEGAIRALETACDRMEKNPMAWLWLSRAYTVEGMEEPATRAFARAEYLNVEAADAFGPPPGPREGANTP